MRIGELRDLYPHPYIKHRPTGGELLKTVLYRPSQQEMNEALRLYQRDTAGFPGEMTQEDLNRYIEIVRSGRGFRNG